MLWIQSLELYLLNFLQPFLRQGYLHYTKLSYNGLGQEERDLKNVSEKCTLFYKAQNNEQF
jgi:hypothetical protein